MEMRIAFVSLLSHALLPTSFFQLGKKKKSAAEAKRLPSFVVVISIAVLNSNSNDIPPLPPLLPLPSLPVAKNMELKWWMIP